ncbi:MAG: metal-sulfur cluster assembly factor [Desulfobacterales bacterium]|nr:metal-sulfur cluster assembly factor [Desulfobacterales bacterium]
MKNSLKKITGQGIIILLLISLLWMFKMLPGWIIEREMKKQLSLLPSSPRVFHTAGFPPGAEETVTHEQTSQAGPVLISENEIYAALKFIKDPEIDINVVDLGLIRDIRIDRKGITVTMMLTTRFCPHHRRIVNSVREAVKKISTQETINIIVDYSKTWTTADLTEAGKKHWDNIFKNGNK